MTHTPDPQLFERPINIVVVFAETERYRGPLRSRQVS